MDQCQAGHSANKDQGLVTQEPAPNFDRMSFIKAVILEDYHAWVFRSRKLQKLEKLKFVTLGLLLRA
jgi:hypothetical protein